MGDFSMSQKEQETLSGWQLEEQRRLRQREEQSQLQGEFLQLGKDYDVRESELRHHWESRERIRGDRNAWKQIQQNAGMVNMVVPEGCAIGSPVQKEPAESEKQRKDRLKKLDKVDKKNYGYVSYRSIALQEKVNASCVSREKIAKQREEDRKKDIDEAILLKEEAKQNLIRAFSHDVRTDRFGKPIKEDEEKAKKNEAFKNNMEGHMSGVVQWVYQVDLNPQKLNDAYVQGHSSELFQTAERLKTFFDYYNLMGGSKWERGFLNNSAIVGARGKEILEIKAKQAEIFRDLLSDKFKTVLSVDMETGKFLTDHDRVTLAANVKETQEDKKKTLNQERRNEANSYYQMAVSDMKGKISVPHLVEVEGNPELKEILEENDKNEERYNILDDKLDKFFQLPADEKEFYTLPGYEENAKTIRTYIRNDKVRFDQVCDSLVKYMQVSYSNQTVLGKNLQEVVNQERKELQEESRNLIERLDNYEDGFKSLFNELGL